MGIYYILIGKQNIFEIVLHFSKLTRQIALINSKIMQIIQIHLIFQKTSNKINDIIFIFRPTQTISDILYIQFTIYTTQYTHSKEQDFFTTVL